MKKYLFLIFRYIISIFSKLIGPIHAPFTHKLLKYQNYLDIKGIVVPGDVILIRTRGEVTTFVIPGYWKHTAIYAGNDKVFHATGKGADFEYLADLIMTTDYIVIMRDRACDSMKFNEFEKMQEKKVEFILKKFHHVPYDYGLDIKSKKSVYCSELEFHGYNFIHPFDKLVPKKRMGFDAFTPDDIFKARKRYEIIYTTCL